MNPSSLVGRSARRLRSTSRLAARRAMRLMPAASAERLTALRTSSGRSGGPLLAGPSATLVFPDDLADGPTLLRRLADTDLFGASRMEAEGYLADALDRFRITMSLLPQLHQGTKVLELGANPYFLTRLLRERGLTVTCANWFGAASGFGARGNQVVTESGTAHTYRFDHFNIEEERFPYQDGFFDLVLFCEIIEHLPADPIHALCEIGRVLRPGGTLILTTPNASRLQNLLRIGSGDNVYEQLSGYGTYGRHNREYTVDELQRLLLGVGFDVEQVIDLDIGHAPDRHSLPFGASPEHRGENLFAVAIGTGQPIWHYPSWLYSSTHALKRVIAPELVVGVNCELQSSGLYNLERDDRGAQRWTGPELATILIDAGPRGADLVVVEGVAPPPVAGDIHVVLAGPKGSANVIVAANGLPFRIELELELMPGPAALSLSTDRTWTPGGPDTRQLGVQLRGIAAVDTRLQTEPL